MPRPEEPDQGHDFWITRFLIDQLIQAALKLRIKLQAAKTPPDGLAGPTNSIPPSCVRYRVFRIFPPAQRSRPKLLPKNRKLAHRFRVQADREGEALERETPALPRISIPQSVLVVASEPKRP